MCVICVKKKGVRLPTKAEFASMWARNPHGAGYMYARNGKLTIRKGFMSLLDLFASIQRESLRETDTVIFHFRISTQGGVNQEMCHPFPVSHNLEDMEKLELDNAQIGFAHNGIIERTTSKNCKYSDTALFIVRFVSHLIRSPYDVGNYALNASIQALAPHNRFAIMNGRGKVSLIGNFEEVDGLLYSNTYHLGNYGVWCKKGGNY